MASSALGTILGLGLIVGAGALGVHLAEIGDFGPDAKKVADDILSSLHFSTAGGGSGCSFDSTTLKLPAWVGVEWCKTHTGGPASVNDLDTWGDSLGYHHPDGTWQK